LEQLKKSLDSNIVQPTEYQELEAEAEAVQREIEELQVEFRTLDVDKALRELGTKQAAEEHKLSSLNQEMARANSQAELKARFTIRSTEKTRRQHILDGLIKTCVDDFQRGLQKQTKDATLEADINAITREQQRDMDEAQSTLNKANRDLSARETEMTMHKKTVADIEKQVETKARALKAVLEDRNIEEFQQVLAEVEKELTEAKA
jgi:hypothetical protein